MKSAAAIALLLGLVAATALADPMRPLDPAAPGSAPAGAERAAAPADAPAPVRLRATRSDSAGRWQALWGTRWLSPGDRLDGARVEEVGPNHVLLLRGRQRQTIYLLPPLQASPARPASARPQ